MTVRLIEGALDDLVSMLQSGISAKLDALNAEYNDPYVLKPIVKWHIGEVPFEVPEYPSVVIRPDPSGFQLEEDHPDSVHGSSLLNIIVLVGDPDIETRFRWLARYARALFELIHTWEQTCGYEIGMTGQWNWSSVMPKEPFLQGLSFPVKLTVRELF